MLNQRRRHAESMQSQCKAPRNPCRTHAEPVESPCKTQAETVHNRCRFHAESMRIPCKTHAESMQPPRRIHAEPMQHPCRIHAEAMHNPRRTPAAPVQNPCRSHANHARLFFCNKHLKIKREQLLGKLLARSFSSAARCVTARATASVACCAAEWLLRSGVSGQATCNASSKAVRSSFRNWPMKAATSAKCLRPSIAKLF